MMIVIKADATSPRGLRNVIDGETELLQGFEFNANAKFDACMYAPYTATIDRPTGVAAVNIPSFIPALHIVAPEGTTHFKLVSAAAAINFETETFSATESSTAIMPWNNTATAVIDLSNALPAAGTQPLFLAFGIQFYQQVNGVEYPLKNGAFNALSLVMVSGV